MIYLELDGVFIHQLYRWVYNTPIIAKVHLEGLNLAETRKNKKTKFQGVKRIRVWIHLEKMGDTMW